MPDYTTSPKYQRAMARLRRMSPEQQAIVSSVGVDKSFANAEMRKKIRSMDLATTKERRRADLKLGERRLALGKRRHEFAKSQILPATLIGLGQVGLGVAQGIQQRRTSQQMARALLSQRQQYTGGGTTTTTPGPAPYRAPGWTGAPPSSGPSPTSGWTRATPQRRQTWGK